MDAEYGCRQNGLEVDRLMGLCGGLRRMGCIHGGLGVDGASRLGRMVHQRERMHKNASAKQTINPFDTSHLFGV